MFTAPRDTSIIFKHMNEASIEDSLNYVKGLGLSGTDTALVLGSGLGHLADDLEDKLVIEYSQIPGFPRSTVAGHASRLIAGKLENIPLIVFQGRFHSYEGYSLEQIAFPFRFLARLGCRNLILTNAAGGINRSFQPGDLMMLTDHINFTFHNPLTGSAFNDMSRAYDPGLGNIIIKAAENVGLDLKKGIYGWTGGPSFETASEIKMMRILGADAVGMSTVPEAITAVDAGLKVAAVSCISNMACGILDQPITMDEVIETGREAGVRFSQLIRETIKLLHEESP